MRFHNSDSFVHCLMQLNQAQQIILQNIAGLLSLAVVFFGYVNFHGESPLKTLIFFPTFLGAVLKILGPVSKRNHRSIFGISWKIAKLES